MTGKLRDLTINRDRTQNITVTIGADFREQFDELKDKQIDIVIKPHREKRSLSANAFLWVVIDKIAEKLNEDKITVYREAIRHIGGVSVPICVRDRAVKYLREDWESRGVGWITETMDSKIDGCTTVILYFGSSTYDKAQMSRLIDQLLRDAEDIGLVIEKPSDLIYEKHEKSKGAKENGKGLADGRTGGDGD